jgi:hypothetical protein
MDTQRDMDRCYLHFEINGQPTFFSSRFEGVKPEAEWVIPTRAEGDEHWEYIGPIVNGTYEHPKGWNDLSWDRQMHLFDVDGKQLYYSTLGFNGIPSHAYLTVEDLIADTNRWFYSGERRHAGTYADPKDIDEVTWPGAIHVATDSMRQFYHRSLMEGAPHDFPAPAPGVSNSYWAYVDVVGQPGTYIAPKERDETTWKGAIHATPADRGYARVYYESKVDGPPPGGGRAFPTHDESNEYWQYIGRDVHDGTLLDPKSTTEFTWPGAIHAAPENGYVRFFRSNFLGTHPPENGWTFPSAGSTNAEWTLVNTSRHTGTYADPKPWNDWTWPGAIHNHRYNGAHWYFKAKKEGIPSANNWVYPTSPSSNEHWEYLSTERFAGNYDSPKDLSDPTFPGAIHAHSNAVDGKRYYFKSLMAGVPADMRVQYPEQGAENEYFTYLGSTSSPGTYDTPRSWSELTWPGRVYRYEINGKILYFTALQNGTPSEHGWYYPTTATSNQHWSLLAESAHAGNFQDPKDWTDVTWPGAMHADTQAGTLHYYAARHGGIPSDLGVVYPVGAQDNEQWHFIAIGKHPGTWSEPKDQDEPTWPGAIHIKRIGQSRVYYSSRNDGIPSEQGWPYPADTINDKNWVYEGTGNHEGTYSDPHKWDEPTWPGAIHAYKQADMRAYFVSRIGGVPSKTHAYYPTTQSSNPQWEYKGSGRHSGAAADAKDWDEFSWPGALHYSTVNARRVLFASKNEGVPSQNGWKYPQTEEDDANWTFAGQAHAGTFADPRHWNEPTLPGAKHYSLINKIAYFYTAKFTGNAALHNWYFPDDKASNSHWTYAGQHYGTFDDPRTREDPVWPGAITRMDNAGEERCYEARKDGSPTDAGWTLPASGSSNEHWIDKGRHAGTLADPKNLNEPTWPGAIHRAITPDGTYFYTSRFAGTPSNENRPYPSGDTSNASWTHLAYWRETAPGINDFSRPFIQYTWATAHNAYLNSIKEQLERGIRGFMLDLHPTHSIGGTPYLALCHGEDGGLCIDSNKENDEFAKTLNDVYLPFLKANPSAVITLILESYANREQFENDLKKVTPEFLAMVFDPGDYATNTWPLLAEMIRRNKRVVILADRTESSGRFDINGLNVHVLKSGEAAVENTYDLASLLDHDWECKTRDINRPLNTPQASDSKGWPRLFIMNQFHAFGSSQAHAGDVDNNLTWLQRRVLDECLPVAERNPNYIAVDYNQVGDTLAYAAALSQGGIYFYERANADRGGDTVCVLPALHNHDLQLPAYGCENDEIKSVQLAGVARGTRILLFDSPSASKSDDFTYIDVKKVIPINSTLTINSLETSYANADVAVYDFHNNNLRGKVSRIIVGFTPENDDFSTAEIVFHEGNYATENIVCTVPFHQSDRFKMGPGNSFGCDNDEIRSATIVRAKKGSAISLVGSPNGTFNEGKAAVTVLRDIIEPKGIPSFNQSYEDDFIKVEVTGGGNLDGKISYGYFTPAQ